MQKIKWIRLITLVLISFILMNFVIAENNSSNEIACTTDVLMCNDGTFVSRDSNCKFYPCPVNSNNNTNITTVSNLTQVAIQERIQNEEQELKKVQNKKEQVQERIQEAYKELKEEGELKRQDMINKLKDGEELTIGEKKMLIKSVNKKIRQLHVRGFVANTELEIAQSGEGENKKLVVTTPHGNIREIKIMPDTATERAIERLRLKNCNETNNCTIQLKNVGKKEAEKLVYTIQARKKAKIIGFINSNMKKKVEIDAETGEIIKTTKPWWSFLAKEVEEVSESN